MKRTTNIREWTAIAAVAAGLAGVVWSALELDARSSSARQAADNLEGTAALARRILEARRTPARAAAATWSDAEINSRIVTAAETAALPTDALTTIQPEPARRLADTPYLQQTTRIDLAGITLPQLAGFLSQVTRPREGLSVTRLRIRPDTRRAASRDGERWLAEATLTQLVYNPITRPPR